jgi:hypothetical protein
MSRAYSTNGEKKAACRIFSELLGFWSLSIARYSRNWKTTFRTLDLFPSSGEGGRHLLR